MTASGPLPAGSGHGEGASLRSSSLLGPDRPVEPDLSTPHYILPVSRRTRSLCSLGSPIRPHAAIDTASSEYVQTVQNDRPAGLCLPLREGRPHSQGPYSPRERPLAFTSDTAAEGSYGFAHLASVQRAHRP